MSPLSSPSVLLWIGLCIATQRVMDVQKDLLGWLEEATLFPSATTGAKPQQLDDQFNLCFNDLIDSTADVLKAKSQSDNAFLDLPDVSDILVENDWMDEKIDLSILDSSQEWLNPVIDATNVLPEVQEQELPLESYVDYFLSSPEANLSPQNEQETLQENNTGFLSLDYLSADASGAPTSSGCINLPESGLQLPSSPSGSSCSGSSFTSNGDTSSPFRYEQSSFDMADGNVRVELESPPSYCVEISSEEYTSVSPQPMGVEPTTLKSVSHRAGGGKDMSFMQNSLKSKAKSRSPYQLKKESRRERKKVQNKEAAARYRIKKREQDRLLSDEVAVLEAEQAELKEKHDKLKSEITYLKSLMRELFQARGILKQPSKKK